MTDEIKDSNTIGESMTDLLEVADTISGQLREIAQALNRIEQTITAREQ